MMLSERTMIADPSCGLVLALALALALAVAENIQYSADSEYQ